jgi:hypothetical protein
MVAIRVQELSMAYRQSPKEMKPRHERGAIAVPARSFMDRGAVSG